MWCFRTTRWRTKFSWRERTHRCGYRYKFIISLVVCLSYTVSNSTHQTSITELFRILVNVVLSSIHAIHLLHSEVTLDQPRKSGHIHTQDIFVQSQSVCIIQVPLYCSGTGERWQCIHLWLCTVSTPHPLERTLLVRVVITCKSTVE